MSKLVWALVLLAGAVASAQPLGLQMEIEEFPSLAQVEFRVALLWVQQCAGSILTNRHIVTAAVCVSGPLYIPENRRIRVGASQRSRGGEIYSVEAESIHPNYGLLGNDADIAVIRLEQYLTFGETVQQAPILGQGIELPGGMTVQLAGWGTTAEGGEVSSANLYKVDLIVHNNNHCLNKYQVAEEPHAITENMICVGLGYSTGRDFDSRDIGASLLYEKTLVGLLAFGQTTDDDLPAVATAIGSYTNWIIANAV